MIQKFLDYIKLIKVKYNVLYIINIKSIKNIKGIYGNNTFLIVGVNKNLNYLIIGSYN